MLMLFNWWSTNVSSVAPVRGVLTVCWLDVSKQRTGAKPGALSNAAVRLVLRCIVGQLVGRHGDLAGSVLGVHELLLSPLSLGRLVI